MKRIRDEHDSKRNAQDPRSGIVRIACAGMAENEQRLHHHEEADAKQRVVAAMVQEVGIVVQNLEAEIRTESHHEARLQKIAVTNAQAILANEEYDNRHDSRHRELCDVLIIAALDKALFNSTALIEYEPVPDKESYHQDCYSYEKGYDMYFLNHSLNYNK